MVYELDRIACRGLVPDLTLVIDIDTETGLARAHRRSVRTEDSETRIEEQDVGFHRRVREAYRQLAADEPARVTLIDGSQTREAVAEQVWQAVESVVNSSPITPAQLVPAHHGQIPERARAGQRADLGALRRCPSAPALRPP